MASNKPMPELAVPDATKQKKRQYAIMIGGGAALLALSAGLMYLGGQKPEGKPAPTDAKEVRKDFQAPGVSDKEVWIAKSDAQLKELQQQNQELRQQMQALQNAGNGAGTPPPPLPPFETAGTQEITPPASLPPPPPLPPLNAATTPPAAGTATAPAESTAPQRPAGVFHLVIPDNAPKRDGQGAGQAPAGAAAVADEQQKPKTVGTYLPAGSFANAVLLGGLDAPTGGQAQSNPHPALLMLTDHAILPNRFRSRVRECTVIGSGYGDISSERAYIRTETLSCVLKNGTVIETKIKGYVAGEDGKTGLRGTLVSKDGQLLARALIAGLGSGFGQGLAQSVSTIATSPLGATQVVDPAKIAQYGAYTGVGKALDRLAQYYISMAEKTFPIVEIAAKRRVTVVLTQGAWLEGNVNGGSLSGSRPIIQPEDVRNAARASYDIP